MARLSALAFTLLLAVPSAFALDYRSAAEVAVLWDAPSAKARKLYIVAKGSPVELVSAQEAWSKVRDDKGNMAWIENKSLSSVRTVLVRADKAQVRDRADEKAPLVFEAEKDVVLDWLEPGPAGWVKVKHKDGQSGFVRIGQVWGL
ncbi:MAG TPA: SH3 domain-containing protein [Rhodocyclaceae bacterium]|jgi:SH3-like domain-containing protein